MTNDEFVREYLPKGHCPGVLLGEHCDPRNWDRRCRYYHRTYGHRKACENCWRVWIKRLRKEDIAVEIFDKDEENE